MSTLIRFLLGFSLVLTSLFMILLVLIQRGRGGGLAGAFGGMGGQSAFGTKAGDIFTRITVGVAAVWILLCITTLNLLGRPQSLFAPGLGGAAVPAVPPRQPAPPRPDQPDAAVPAFTPATPETQPAAEAKPAPDGTPATPETKPETTPDNKPDTKPVDGGAATATPPAEPAAVKPPADPATVTPPASAQPETTK